MNAGEIDEFLKLPLLSNLATLRPDGSPHVAPVWHLYDGDRLLILSSPTSVKVQNLRGDPRIGISIPRETEPHGFVQVNGTAELSTEWDRQVLWDMSINYQGKEEGNRYAEETYRSMEFVLITITPGKMAGWTFP
jgi:PPOX class probable F420-dependent enzyme